MPAKKREPSKPQAAMKRAKQTVMDLHKAAGIEWDERSWRDFITDILTEIASPIAKAVLLKELGIQSSIDIIDDDEQEDV